MRVLHTVEFYSPSVGGAQEVVRQISEGLTRRGHQVTVATTKLRDRTARCIEGVAIEEFDISGNTVRGIRGEISKYHEFLLSGQFDVMLTYAAQQWTADAAFPILDRLPYRKVLAPCGFSGLYNPGYAIYFALLPEAMRSYDHLVFHSSTYRDVEFARQHGLNRYSVIPNGAAASEFDHNDPTFRQRYGIPEDLPMLLTVGSHTGAKGHALAIEALSRARFGPAVLVIIGNVYADEGCLPSCRRRAAWTTLLSRGKKRVLLLDPPRPDVVAAYHAADLFVFGSNIECSPIVLFEAMASRTPFATVACGNAEEIIEWSQGGALIPTRRRSDGMVQASPDAMARVIEDMIRDPQKRMRLAEAGYQAWQREFSWEQIVGRYEQLYQTLVGGGADT